MSGYVNCACRDCFEIAISGDDGEPALCNECEEAGCEPNDGECQAEGAYGADEGNAEPTTPREHVLQVARQKVLDAGVDCDDCELDDSCAVRAGASPGGAWAQVWIYIEAEEAERS